MSDDRQLDREPFYTIPELAGQLRFTERHIRKLIERGDLSYYRFGRAIRLDPKDVEVFLARRRVASR